MAIHSPINAFQRNSIGTFDRIDPTINVNPANYVPLGVDPPPVTRDYSQFKTNNGPKILTGEITPIDVNYFCKNGETSFYPRQQLVQSEPVRVNNLNNNNSNYTREAILARHPNFKSIFYTDQTGLLKDFLLIIASHCYDDRTYFTTYDLMCISEGKLIPEDQEVSIRMAQRDLFYSPFFNYDTTNYYKRDFKTKEALEAAQNYIGLSLKYVSQQIGESFYDIYNKRNRDKMARVNNLDIGVTHGKSAVGNTISGQREDAHSGPISFKVTYFNHCPFDVVVVDRTGLRQVVKSRTLDKRPSVVVRRSYTIVKEAFDGLNQYFTYTPEDALSNTMKVLKSQLYIALKNNPNTQSVFITVDNTIDASELSKNNGDIYVVSEDLIISDKPLMKAPNHPFNSKTFNADSFKVFSNANGDVGINFEIVDNDNVFGERFIMLAKKIHKIIPKRDMLRQSGLYITTMERDPTQEGLKKPNQIYYPLENLEDNFGIYKTSQEAETGGDIHSLRKESMMEMEHNYKVDLQNLKNISLDRERENTSLKHELQQAQIRNDIDNQTRKERIVVLEEENRAKDIAREEAERQRKETYAERERIRNEETIKLQHMNRLLEADLERQRSMMKDYYDGRSYNRKDTSEIFRWLPTIITGILSIVGIVFMKTKMAV